LTAKIKFYRIDNAERGFDALTVRRGLFVGRFQPFHKGHTEAVKDILEKMDEIIIVIGSAQYSHRLDNPFTTGERVTMIRDALNEAKIPLSKVWIVPVEDLHVHMLWVAKIVGFSPEFSFVYTNEPLTRRLFTEAGFKAKPIPFHKRTLYSATEIRKRMLADEDWEALVPKSVAICIREMDGVNRLRDLAKTDEGQKGK